MLKTVFALPLLLVPTIAMAQGVSSSSDLLADAQDDRWTLGVAVSVRDSPYVGEGTRVRPLMGSASFGADCQEVSTSSNARASLLMPSFLAASMGSTSRTFPAPDSLAMGWMLLPWKTETTRWMPAWRRAGEEGPASLRSALWLM